MKRRLLGSSLFTVALLFLGSAASAATPSESAFLTKAIKGDNSEIMLGKLAQERGTATKDFGGILINDHTQARDQAEQLAKSLGSPIPTGPTAEANQQDAKLGHLSGAAFDHAFVADMIMDHKKDIAAFQRKADEGNGPVPSLAKKTLPTLEKHLHIAESLKAKGE